MARKRDRGTAARRALPPRVRRSPATPSWLAIATGYGLIAAVAVLLWAASNPVVATATVGTLVGLRFGAPRLRRLLGCVRHCEQVTFELGRTVRITVSRPPA